MKPADNNPMQETSVTGNYTVGTARVIKCNKVQQ
jgi:hypothetical protein